MAHSARSWSRLSPCEWRASFLSILHRPNRFPISVLHRGRVGCPRGARWLDSPKCAQGLVTSFTRPRKRNVCGGREFACRAAYIPSDIFADLTDGNDNPGSIIVAAQSHPTVRQRSEIEPGLFCVRGSSAGQQRRSERAKPSTRCGSTKPAGCWC